MPNPQQPELRRSERAPTSDDAAKIGPTDTVPPDEAGSGPVPPENQPGHHPEHDQDKPEGPPRRGARGAGGRPRARASARQAASDTAVTPVELAGRDGTYTGLAAGPVDGPVVFFLAGCPQRASAWRDVLPACAGAGFRAVAVDQRGYAPAVRPTRPDAYRLRALVDDVLTLADGMGADRFSVVGHDWGGVVGWALAATAAERVTTLTSVSTPHPRAYTAALATSHQAVQSAYIGFFVLPVVPELVLRAGRGAVLRRLLRRSGLPDDRTDEYVDALLEPDALTAALNWYRAAPAGALASVGDVDVPTLFVWGDADPALGRRAAEGTAGHVTGPYRFVPLAGVGHWIPETAADVLAPLVVDHLRSFAAVPS